jgi:general L-amino acid transport system substrate-binding protein
MLRTGGNLRRSARNWRFLAAITIAIATFMIHAPAGHAGEVLDRIKLDGIVRCGVTNSGPGLSEIGPNGSWHGLFVDYCRAIAAAVLNDPEAVEYVEVNDIVRFEALREDGFDVLLANTTWTIGRDTDLGLSFTGVIYYDGQSFLAHRSLGASSLAEVEEARVCVSGGTTTFKNVEELASANLKGLTISAFQSIDGTYEAFFARECEIMTYDRIALIAQLRSRASDPDNFVLFPEIISKEPLGPAVRRGDQEWFDIVRWTVLVTIAAEELGITSTNVTGMMSSARPETRRLLGVEGNLGEGMGLDRHWAANVIRHVGNYREVFDRNVGADSPLGMDRGLNALWVHGGLHYAPPIR